MVLPLDYYCQPNSNVYPGELPASFRFCRSSASGCEFLAVQFLGRVLKKMTMTHKVSALDEPIHVGLCS
jgi:hypothetical protein